MAPQSTGDIRKPTAVGWMRISRSKPLRSFCSYLCPRLLGLGLPLHINVQRRPHEPHRVVLQVEPIRRMLVPIELHVREADVIQQ